jgi:hypothetical protein
MRYTSDHLQLQETLRRFLHEKVSVEYRKNRIAAKSRLDPQLLKEIDSLGLVEGFSGPEALFGFIELGILAHECGRVLMPEPIVDRLLVECCLPAMLPADSGNYLTAERAKGRVSIAVARPLVCRVTSSVDGLVSGSIEWVSGVEGASHIIVWFVDTPKEGGVRVQPLAALISCEHPGVSTREVPSLDLLSSSRSVELAAVPAVLLSPRASALLEQCLDLTGALEAAGVCERVIEITCDYLRVREQFGVPIGGFQALQHAMANSYAQSESLSALARFGAWSVVSSPEQVALVSRAASLQAAVVGPAVCEAAIQVHGGIGFTWEYELHLYLRRARTIAALYSWEDRRVSDLLSKAVGQ